MKEAGYKSIEIAKENGSWTILNSVDNLELPQDLAQELNNHKGATGYYESLTKSVKKSLLYWIASAKRNETRHKRIIAIAENASVHRLPKQFR